jgi:hypothetical protein
MMSIARILPWYYAATAVFLALDFGLGINVRVAFLDEFPTERVAYYGICFTCLSLMVWRPRWAPLIGTFESLATLVALILSMAVRVMVPNDAIFEESAAFVSVQEIINFVISGSVAYFAWVRGLKTLRNL